MIMEARGEGAIMHEEKPEEPRVPQYETYLLSMWEAIVDEISSPEGSLLSDVDRDEAAKDVARRHNSSPNFSTPYSDEVIEQVHLETFTTTPYKEVERLVESFTEQQPSVHKDANIDPKSPHGKQVLKQMMLWHGYEAVRREAAGSA